MSGGQNHPSISSVLSMPSSDLQSNAPLKRRACDECSASAFGYYGFVANIWLGSRKLACSKEPDGCTRCVREGIRCHYSEQKPMGRPRKRQANGEIKEGNTEFQPIISDFDPLPYFDDSFQVDSFIDTGGLQFPSNASDYPAIFPEQAQATGLCTVNDGRLVFHFGVDELNVPIDFAAENASPEALEPVTPSAQGPVRHALELFAGDHPAPSASGPPCSCLATMYLAMSSLQEFPNEVETALTTVRSAATTAQSSIRCPKCGNCTVTMMIPPIESFQNTMLLGTILPIIANGYKRLLVMVDEETERSKALGIKKVFRISAYGGLCGPDTLCGAAQHLDESVMEPDDWRAAVRGLLRVDVYGMDGITPGLRGIISEMEQRQRRRHKEMHQLHQPNGFADQDVGQRTCLGEKDMLCLRILDTAKTSIDTLVIP